MLKNLGFSFIINGIWYFFSIMSSEVEKIFLKVKHSITDKRLSLNIDMIKAL